jgi:hypothetical protein
MRFCRGWWERDERTNGGQSKKRTKERTKAKCNQIRIVCNYGNEVALLGYLVFAIIRFLRFSVTLKWLYVSIANEPSSRSVSNAQKTVHKSSDNNLSGLHILSVATTRNWQSSGSIFVWQIEKLCNENFQFNPNCFPSNYHLIVF